MVPTRRLVVLAFASAGLAAAAGLLPKATPGWIVLDVVLVLGCCIDALAGRGRRISAELSLIHI